jgi:hypothetical protein
MSEILSNIDAAIADAELLEPAAGEVEERSTHEVIATYSAHLKAGVGEKRAFSEAVRIYQARHPAVRNAAARRAVAVIICHKL